MTIKNWPKDHSVRVPNKISYEISPRGYEQWGYEIEDDNILTSLRERLEQPLERHRALEKISELVYFTTAQLSHDLRYRPPEQVSGDFLPYVAAYAQHLIAVRYDIGVVNQAPVDIVVSYYTCCINHLNLNLDQPVSDI
ncbi:hypothetical protein B0T24DRAFT_596151 [Lasiosphaeria ovina]|uniref:Uncharacterized protein n=1 Tax=Lasiosphaeria ovina TaxID=92902 RepID=A0AAE0N4R6_9PEZI|nr:hypothetical protein B0T24DRAFT_596151 [Lasiosphaeria ovina]